jgi:hypothetical protein
MTDAGVVVWLMRGSVPARIAKTWLASFVSATLIMVIWLLLFGVPDSADLATSAALFGIATALIVGIAFGPIDDLPSLAMLLVSTIAYFFLAALPGSFAGGVIIGLFRRMVE